MASRKTRQKILFLETQLDQKLGSLRTQIDFMKSFFKNYSGTIDFITKEVHSRSDLVKFLNHARRDKSVIAIHIVGHGKASKNKCLLVLTMNEEIDLKEGENQKIFTNLNDCILFFSCCQIGSDVQVMRRILKHSKAEAIFSYSDDVTDDQAFLIESLFYHLLIGNVPKQNREMSIFTIYEKLKFVIDYLLIDHHKEPLSDPLLVADFYEDLKKEV
jgi:hypothetical protein